MLTCTHKRLWFSSTAFTARYGFYAWKLTQPHIIIIIIIWSDQITEWSLIKNTFPYEITSWFACKTKAGFYMSPRLLRTFSLQALSHENIKGPKMNKLENNLYGQKSSTNQGGARKTVWWAFSVAEIWWWWLMMMIISKKQQIRALPNKLPVQS